MFKNAIAVEGVLYDTFENMSDKELPAQLELRIKDLKIIKHSLDEKLRSSGIDTADKRGWITDGAQMWGTNPFDYASPHERAIYSDEFTSPNIRFNYGDYTYRLDKKPPETQMVIAAKGSGYRKWLHESAAEFTKAKKSYKIPILRWIDPPQSSYVFLGGESTYSAKWQYVSALILHALSQRHNLPEVTYTPIKITNFQELPVFESGTIIKVPISEYCSQSKTLMCDGKFRLPTKKEGTELAELFYFGDSVHLRVPPRSFKVNDGECRAYSVSWLFDPEQRTDVVRERITDFVSKIAHLLRIVHAYNGTFSKEWSGNSSLLCRNVSLSGIICDLDTVDFSITNPKALRTCQENDIFNALRTVECFANLFEEISQKDTNFGYKVSAYCGDKFPVYGFAKHGLDVFRKIYPSSFTILPSHQD